MIDCGSQCFLCDVPIRLDTYMGCTHNCKYCFVYRKYDISNVKVAGGIQALKNFVVGKRTQETKWCNWNIPLHWGGMSDPFQPCEKKHRASFECLKIFAETQYPFIVSTKGKLIADNEYLELLSKCNAVVQISLVSPKYDKIETGCPTYYERIEIIKKVAPRVKRINIRIQPYMREAKTDIINHLELYKNIGVYGIILEGMNLIKKVKGLEKLGGDYVYPLNELKCDFTEIKEKAHKLGLKVYMGENRLRNMGDDLCCCGIDGLKGFKGNDYNLNHYLFDEKKTIPVEAMKNSGSSMCFKTLFQNTESGPYFKKNSFKDVMDLVFVDKKYRKILGK